MPITPMVESVMPIRPIPPMFAPSMPLVNSVAPMTSYASVPMISAITPPISAPIPTPIVAPTSVMGNEFMSGGFSLVGDVDPITPGLQSNPGVVTAVGPTRVF